MTCAVVEAIVMLRGCIPEAGLLCRVMVLNFLCWFSGSERLGRASRFEISFAFVSMQHVLARDSAACSCFYIRLASSKLLPCWLFLRGSLQGCDRMA